MCTFFNIYKNECNLLTETNCRRCKFRKTESEFEAGQARAAHILNKKKLRAVKRNVNGELIMTTKEVLE